MPTKNDKDLDSKSQNQTSKETKIQGAATAVILNEEENAANDDR